MALQDEITRIKQAKADIKASIEAKGGSVGDGLIDTYASAIDNLPSGGGDLSGYFSNTASIDGSDTFFAKNLIKKIPDVDLTGITTMSNAFDGFQRLEELNLADVSEVKYMESLCHGCTSLTKVAILNTIKTTNMRNMFNGCVSLKEVEELQGEKTIIVEDMFNGCENLETFGGIKNLGKSYLSFYASGYSNYTFDLSYCTKLSYESLMNVLNGLYDISSKKVKTQNIILGETNLAKLQATEEGQQAIITATNKGWEVS